MILFRVDGNEIIGLGHLMRCLSVARAFSAEGEECVFIISDDGQRELITSYGQKCHILKALSGNQTDAFSVYELGEMFELAESYQVRAFFVDSYEVNKQYLSILMVYCRERKIRLIYLDDVLLFPYSADVVINYNIYAARGSYNKLYAGMKMPKLMLGTEYTPLRDEFRGIPKRKVKKKAKNIFLSTGGADKEHMGLALIKTIAEHVEWMEYEFRLVVGSACQDERSLELVVGGCSNIILLKHIKKMSQAMQDCDVAISASGSTLYELCATQTPTVMYVLADNQLLGAAEFRKLGLIKYAGDVRDLGPVILAEKVLNMAVELAKNYAARNEAALRMSALVDGKGAKRLVEGLMKEIA